MSKACILIPSRFKSTRFPGKPLALILGKPMIQWVYEKAQTSGIDVFVVTDHEGIEKTVHDFGGKVLRVDDDVPSGSERIGLAYQRYLKSKSYEFVINVQGDEPLLEGNHLKDLLRFHQSTQYDVTTLVIERSKLVDSWKDPNVVKVVLGSQKNCLYFSRSSVPFDRDGVSEHWFQHVGVYCYRAQALQDFIDSPQSKLADTEQLEQLRGIDIGLRFGAHCVEANLVGVDRPEDIKKVEELIK